MKQAAQDREDAAAAEAEKERLMAMAAAGKALHGALGATPLANLAATRGAVLSATGLAIDQAQGSLNADPDPVTLEARDAAAALGAWSAMN